MSRNRSSRRFAPLEEEAMTKRKGRGNEKKPLVAEGLAPLTTELPEWERTTVLAALKKLLLEQRSALEGDPRAPAP
jgi:hypothetical protein